MNTAALLSHFISVIFFIVLYLILHFIESLIQKQDNFDDDFECALDATEEGDAAAQYNLGRMYLEGKGSDKNILEARFWMKLAIENDIEYIRILAQEVWDKFKLGSY